MSTINGKRLSKGLGPVGFVNPTLYANPHVFDDITDGDNTCTIDIYSTVYYCCASGFDTSVGWDPVTGKCYIIMFKYFT